MPDSPSSNRLRGVVARPARCTCSALVGQRHLLETSPAAESSEVTRAFGQRVHHVHHASIEQAEVPSVAGQLGLTEAMEDPVEERVLRATQQALLAVGAHAVDDSGSGFPGLEEARQQLGRVLEIGVQDPHGVAATLGQSRAQGSGLPKVPREDDSPHRGFTFRPRANDFPGLLGTAVVHQQDLGVRFGFADHRQQSFEELVHDPRLLVHGHDHRESRRSVRGGQRPTSIGSSAFQPKATRLSTNWTRDTRNS